MSLRERIDNADQGWDRRPPLWLTLLLLARSLTRSSRFR